MAPGQGTMMTDSRQEARRQAGSVDVVKALFQSKGAQQMHANVLVHNCFAGRVVCLLTKHSRHCMGRVGQCNDSVWAWVN
mmetsp:Transcript_20365/g.27434  ORF Transcript_20365/g.27434 Transcript_20365/m.27434 type:complete len:80 (+) Transcript_20365:403-642(+)